MATRRIRYRRTRSPEQFEPPGVYGNFIRDLQAGTVTASRLIEARDARGNLVIDYDDPTGVGQSLQSPERR